MTVNMDIYLSATPTGKFHINISRYPLNRRLGGSESRFGRCDENFPLPPSLVTVPTELALMKFRTSPNSGVDNRPPSNHHLMSPMPPPPNKLLAKVTPDPITGIQNTTLCQKNGNQHERTQNKFNIQVFNTFWGLDPHSCRARGLRGSYLQDTESKCIQMLSSKWMVVLAHICARKFSNLTSVVKLSSHRMRPPILSSFTVMK